MATGIYCIKNLMNNHVYIGQAIDIKSRWIAHKEDLRNHKHGNEHLQRAYNKYGEDSFIFSVLEECDEDKLTEREQFWINYYGGVNSINTYNMREAGSHGRYSDEVKLKISKAQTGVPKAPGRKVSEVGRLSLSRSHKGIYPSTDTRKKMSIAQTGRHHTQESKLKISKAAKQRYIDRPELKQKLSERMSNRCVSEETKRKIGERSSQRRYGESTKAKHSEYLKKAYANGTRKTIKITVWGITKNQSEWSKILDIAPTSLIYQRKKGTVEQYIERSLMNLMIKFDMNKSEILDFLLS